MKVLDKLHVPHPLQFPKFRLMSDHDGFSLTGVGVAKETPAKARRNRMDRMIRSVIG